MDYLELSIEAGKKLLLRFCGTVETALFKAKCKLDYFTLQCRILSLKKRKRAVFQNNAVWVSSFLYHRFRPQ